MRIAREIHRPISEVLEFPSTELNYWAAVFAAESDQSEREIRKFKELMRTRKRKR